MFCFSAIRLLPLQSYYNALDLRVEIPDDRHLTFHDPILPWRNYLAFVPSFSLQYIIQDNETAVPVVKN